MYKKVLLALSFSGFATFSNAGDINAGEELANAQCAACHASQGDWNQPTNPTFPKLAGQYQDYLLLSLKHYKNGNRNNGIMNGIASGLSKQQMEDLAEFFASLDGDLYIQK